MSEAISSPAENAAWWSKTVLVVAAVALVGLPLAALGYRWGLWGLGSAFTALRYLFYLAVAAVVATLVAGGMALVKHRRRDVVVIAHALVIAAIPMAYLLMQYRNVQGVPPIHDITTDAANPPMLSAAVAGVPKRSLSYGNVYAQQEAAYPDIQPIVSSLPVSAAYAKALAAGRSLGWKIAREEPNAGTFQAVDTTFWFGFKDDVIVRVSAHGGGSQVDIRSVSRIGRSDLGKNAARVRAFVSAFNRA